MREIVLDTETTGLDPADGHRIVEIGAVELHNHIPSGNTFHKYINPQRGMPAEAFAVHGLSDDFLKDKPLFADITDEFLAFIEGATLVIHNAAFDMKFLNAELSYVNKPAILPEQAVDSLALARKKHPMGPNSLDALCKRYGIDNTMRDIHGALLDSELLAQVYLELVGGRQKSLTLVELKTSRQTQDIKAGAVRPRPQQLLTRLTTSEIAEHDAFVETLAGDTLWSKLN
ncbi:MAG: DNA polymerase III subunit epsilon [Aestuariivirgaceae bacterium]